MIWKILREMKAFVSYYDPLVPHSVCERGVHTYSERPLIYHIVKLLKTYKRNNPVVKHFVF